MAFDVGALRWLIPSALVTLLGLALAFVVLRAAPGRRQNRRLALVLLLEALVVFGIGFSDTLAPDETGTGKAGDYWAWLSYTITFVPVAYLALLATLDTPLVRPLRGPVLLALVPLPPLFVYTMSIEGTKPEWAWVATIALAFLGAVGVGVYSIVVAISAYRRAPAGSAARTRAKAYATAFITRDALVGLFFLGIIAEGTPFGVLNYVFWYVTSPLALIGAVYMPLLAYGILKTQLFDIDLRIKKGVAATTLMAFFLVGFFVAEQAGQAFISQRAGPYFGLAGAGALALAFVPLRRVAQRVAKRAVPGADESAEYIARRKLQVYRAAVEGAHEDGEVTQKERAMLYRLAGELGLAPDEVAVVEREAREAARGRADLPADSDGEARPSA